jgi:F-box interacting protein
LVPTNTKAYVFNPATRDAIVLPESKRNALALHDRSLPIGLGIDASRGRYKVARAFYRPRDDDPRRMAAMGMEVCTIGGEDDSWRETLEDPPYLMATFWQAAAHCKGCLFYFIDKKSHQSPPQGLIRFNLQDETFGITPLLPYVFPQVEDDDVALSELDGELCASFFCKRLQRVMIFTTEHILDCSDNPHWRCRYVIDVPESHPIMALHGNGGILLRDANRLFRYDLGARGVQDEDGIHEMDRLKYVGHGRRRHAWKYLCFFNLIPYTESLVPLTANKASSQALQ